MYERISYARILHAEHVKVFGSLIIVVIIIIIIIIISHHKCFHMT